MDFRHDIDTDRFISLLQERCTGNLRCWKGKVSEEAIEDSWQTLLKKKRPPVYGDDLELGASFQGPDLEKLCRRLLGRQESSVKLTNDSHAKAKGEHWARELEWHVTIHRQAIAAIDRLLPDGFAWKPETQLDRADIL